MAIALDPHFVVEIRREQRSRTATHSSLPHSSLPHLSLPHEVYLRRRVVVGLVACGVVLAACLGLRAMASRGDGPAPVSTVTPVSASTSSGADAGTVQSGGIDARAAFVVYDGYYVVQPGDTLWSIASSLTDGSVRSYVDELIDLNGSASIDVGQPLLLPVE